MSPQEINHNLGVCCFFIKNFKHVSIAFLTHITLYIRMYSFQCVWWCIIYPRFCQAEEHLNTALQINKHHKTFMMLGKVHLLTGDTDKAIDVYKRAVEWVLTKHLSYIFYTFLYTFLCLRLHHTDSWTYKNIFLLEVM